MAELLVERYFSDDYPELLREIATELFMQFGELEAIKPLGEDQLAQIAFTVAERVRQALGGSTYYVPLGAHDTCARDKEIFDKFRGDYTPLAREYHMSEMRIRQIIARYIRAELKKRQGDLFSAKIAEAAK